MKTASRIVLVATLIFGLSQILPASSIAFNNLGPGDTYESSGFVVGNAGFPETYAVGGTFQPTCSGELDELWLPLWSGYPTEPVTLSLTDDDSGKPGTVLWSTVLVNQLGEFLTMLHLNNLGGPTLTEGQSYWLTAAGTSIPQHNATWQAVNVPGLVSNQANGGAWISNVINQTPAMKIGVVPEPSTLLMLLSATLVGFLLRRRRS